MEEFDKDLEQVGLLKILKVNAKEWPFIALGILGSFIEGIGFPLFAIFFGEVLTVSVADTQHAMHGCIDMYVCAYVLGVLSVCSQYRSVGGTCVLNSLQYVHAYILMYVLYQY